MRYIFLLIFSISSFWVQSQTLKGIVTSQNIPVKFVNIFSKDSEKGTSSSSSGEYVFNNLSLGLNKLIFSSLGKVSIDTSIYIKRGVNYLDIELKESSFSLDQIVVTGTKTYKRKSDSPVNVDVINNNTLANLLVCNLAEGLNYSTGLRLETDCQTCNYTQLRINGLSGSYSQVLINGRSVFSPLTALYGLEQLPSNMIERIEIVKGGGSSLYGSSAIGGVVNVITKRPSLNRYNVNYNFNVINNLSTDNILSGNSSVVVSDDIGVSFFVNSRNRQMYDHNDDNYSELPEIRNNTYGINFFYLPKKNHKIEGSIGSVYEYRFGGEMINVAPHIAEQSEERQHNIFLANLDYEINLSSDQYLVSYIAYQNTDRKHYTGIKPISGTQEEVQFMLNPPYGHSNSQTTQLGFQYNKDYILFDRSSSLIFGTEFISDLIYDEINAYNYVVDQSIDNYSSFLQLDLNLFKQLKLLSGLRVDRHSLLDKLVFNPRSSLLFIFYDNYKFRFNYGSGFRAPQVFDSDMHMSFAGGGVSRIVLDDMLKEETSNSYSASFSFDKYFVNMVYGLTIESFYTRIEGVFTQQYIGEDSFGDIFLKTNGRGALVKGVSADFRFNMNEQFQFQSGYTIQDSKFDESILYSEDLEKTDKFLRTPKNYGYMYLTYLFNDQFKLSSDLVYTGSMDLVHYASEYNIQADEYYKTPDFLTFGLNFTYSDVVKKGMSFEINVGVKNITNSYQNNFDQFKFRDSNFIYGPSLPRTLLFGIKFFS
tara:strand:- start:223 stop:2505 length:2283 start_codon:yes stop_codon:yes gene_type:complete